MFGRRKCQVQVLGIIVYITSKRLACRAYNSRALLVEWTLTNIQNNKIKLTIQKLSEKWDECGLKLLTFVWVGGWKAIYVLNKDKEIMYI